MPQCFPLFRRTFSPRRGEQRGWLLALALAGLAGCGGAGKTDDPQLKPIQAMLEKELPRRTPEEKVVLYLDNHGYSILAAQKQGTIVAIIRRKDTAAVQPVAARVTFYFDANRKLNTFELQRPENVPSQR
ncbi:MAG TPA: hypothetical protein VNH19_17715 [Candidatus Limnocylindrales bacterium]|nr:hypothetical protein [Candidatus Limnocylindrales bacterium]